MTDSEEIDYQAVVDSLTASELSPSAPEAHGMLGGLLCAGVSDAEGAWLGELLPDMPTGDLLAREARNPLLSLAAGTREQLEAGGLEFKLLLPADDRPLAERATAVYDWSRGFLFGLALSGRRESELSEDVRAVLKDFAALTQMDLDDLDETEENEQALMEVTEFIRVAVMLVYEGGTGVGNEVEDRAN